jgi:hypothetical protein
VQEELPSLPRRPENVRIRTNNYKFNAQSNRIASIAAEVLS